MLKKEMCVCGAYGEATQRERMEREKERETRTKAPQYGTGKLGRTRRKDDGAGKQSVLLRKAASSTQSIFSIWVILAHTIQWQKQTTEKRKYRNASSTKGVDYWCCGIVVVVVAKTHQYKMTGHGLAHFACFPGFD